MVVAWGVAKNHPGGQDAQYTLNEIRPSLILGSPMVVENQKRPLQCGVCLRNDVIRSEPKDVADDVNADGDHQQHLDRWIAGLPFATQIIVDEMPWTQQELPKRGKDGT